MEIINYGAELRQFRKHQRLTLEEVEDLTGINKVTIQNIETNKHRPGKDIANSLESFYGSLVHEKEPSPISRDCSDRARKYRLAAGITVRELSARSGMTVTTVHRVEQGRSKYNLKSAHVIEKTLGYPVAFHPEDPRNYILPLIAADKAHRMTEIEVEFQENVMDIITRMIHTAAGSGLHSIYIDSSDFVKWKAHEVTETLEELGYVIAYWERGIAISW